MEPVHCKGMVKIGVLSKIYGVTRQTLLAWERAGFITPTFRSPGGTRYYDINEVRRALGKPGRAYSVSPANPSGVPENPANCIWEIVGSGRQCSLPRGHGVGAQYCRRHAIIIDRRLNQK